MIGSMIGALRVSLGLDSAQFQDGLRKSNSSLNAWGKGAIATASKIGAALGAAFSAGAVIQASDRYVEMTNSLRVLGFTSEQAAARLNDIGEIAKRTRTPLEATAQLYQRVSIASRELGATQEQVMRFTENIGLALAQQGGSAEQAAGALQQLGQALAGGVVRAEEFNSILEGAYPIAQAAANGIDAAGGSVGRLRQLMLDGQVTSKMFFDAILSQTTQLSAAFAGTVPTVGQAMQVLRDQWTLAVGQITGGTSAISSAILKIADGVAVAARFISEYMNQIIGVVTAAAAAYTLRMLPAIIATTRALYAQAAAWVTLRGAMLATGIGAMVVAVGLLIGKLLDLRQETGSWGKALAALGDLAGLVWQGIIQSSAAIPPGLAAVWNAVKADFFTFVSDLQAGWAGFVGGMANSLEGTIFDAVGAKLRAASDTMLARSNEWAGRAIGATRAAKASAADAAATIQAAFAPVGAKMAELESLTSDAAAAYTDLGNAAGDGAGGAGGKAAKGAGKAAKASRDLLAELHKELDARKALIGLTGEERQRLEALQQVQQKLGDEIGRYSDAAIQGAADRIVAIEDEEEAWESVMQRMESLTDGLATAWGDWIAGGLRDFKGFVSNILGSFKSMLSDMIATAAANPIRIAITGAMGGFGGTGGAMAGVPGMGGTGGILGRIGSSIGTAISGAMSGFGSVFSGLFSGGLGGAAGAVTTALSGATSGLAGLATAAGAIAAPLAAVAAVFSFFKSKTKELDRGLRVTVNGMDAVIEQYRKTEKSRFWGLSKKRRTSYEDAPAEIADPIDSALDKVQQSVLDAAKALNVGQTAFADFAYQFKLSTKGMTDAEALEAIQAEIAKFGDAYAAMIPGIKEYQKEGEGAAATLSRLSSSLSVVNGALGDLGLTLYKTSVWGAGAADAFASLFGGLDQFAQASSAYYEAFYSDAERFARLQEVSNKAIRDAGLAVPATREAYRRLVEAQNLSTEAGRKAAAVLIQLAPAFDQIYDAADAAKIALQEQAAAQRQAIADANATRENLLLDLMTEQQRAAYQQAQITAVFRDLNMTVPTTLDGLRAIIAGLDLTGEAGRNALAEIGKVADALKAKLDSAANGPSGMTPREREARADERATARLDAIANERARLEQRLFELTSNTSQLRQRELDAIAPANRALQEMIWRLEDAKAAMDNLTTDKFATLVDYELARAKVANVNMTPASTPAAEKKAQEARQAQDSATLIEMRDYMRTQVNELHRLVRETRDMRMLQEVQSV